MHLPENTALQRTSCISWIILHREGIGVILDWVPAHFPRDTILDWAVLTVLVFMSIWIRSRGIHPEWGTYDVMIMESRRFLNFLIANALFWAEKYHADGLRMDAVASMLYLDYGKSGR